MLNTERNTPTMGARVRKAAYAARLGKRGTLQVDFEHGQWWVTHLPTGAQWGAHDAEGASAFFGFCFEQVTQGDEE